MIHRFRRQFLGPLVIVWLLLTIGALGLRVVVWRELRASIEASVAGAEFSEALNDVFSSLQDAETGQRGYVITGDTNYLKPFVEAEKTFPAAFLRLSELTTNQNQSTTELLTLRGLAELKLEEMKRIIEIRKEKGFKPASDLILQNLGLRYMEQIRTIISRMRAARINLFAVEGEEMRRRMDLAQSTTTAAGLIGLCAGLSAVYLFWIGYQQDKDQTALLEAKLRAERKAEEKSAFLANMSHEIRTPMNAILGFSELLAVERLSPKQAEYVRSIRQSGSSLLQLINDILDLSKIEAGMLVLNPAPADLHEIASFTRTMFVQQAHRKDVQLITEVASEVPGAVLVDSARLRQIVVNLVGNAIKFTEKGHVRVSFSWKPLAQPGGTGQLVLVVEDTGVGIPPEKQDSIFQPFVQGDPRRTSESLGTGLGLSIVKRLADLMSATISLESRPGIGSTFIVVFRDVAVSAGLPASDASADELSISFNELAASRLVVVDDNEVNRKLIREMFDGSHHTILLATNGREALEVITKEKPDLVLLDIRMPVMDGTTALKELRRLPGFEDLPVVAVTASSLHSEEPELRRQFSGYLRKPFTRAALFHELARFIQRADASPKVTAAEAKDASFKNSSTWRQILPELRRIQSVEWPVIRDTVAINASRSFAEKLRKLAAPVDCGPVIHFADRITALTETYSVNELESLLAGFGQLVDSVEKASTTKSGGDADA